MNYNALLIFLLLIAGILILYHGKSWIQTSLRTGIFIAPHQCEFLLQFFAGYRRMMLGKRSFRPSVNMYIWDYFNRIAWSNVFLFECSISLFLDLWTVWGCILGLAFMFYFILMYRVFVNSQQRITQHIDELVDFIVCEGRTTQQKYSLSPSSESGSLDMAPVVRK